MTIVCTYQRPDGHSVVLIQHGRIETGHALCPAIYPVDQLLQPGVLPWSTGSFPTSRPVRSASITACGQSHLQAYLDEFVFRFNRRSTPHAAFRSFLGIAIAKKPATYNMLIALDAHG